LCIYRTVYSCDSSTSTATTVTTAVTTGGLMVSGKIQLSLIDWLFWVQISSMAVSPFFVEDVHKLQLNSLKLISMVWNMFAIVALLSALILHICKGNLGVMYFSCSTTFVIMHCLVYFYSM